MQRIPTHDERHLARVIGEVQSRLARGVPGANEVKIQSAARRGFAACRSVVDTSSDEAIEALDGKAPPAHASGENDGPCADHLIAIEKDLAARRLDPRNGASHENLGAESPCLLESAAGELIAGDASGKSEIILDARGCSRLPSRGFALDDQGPQALG